MRTRLTTRTIILIAIILSAISAGAWLLRTKGDKGPTFRTVAVKRGDLEATISATSLFLIATDLKNIQVWLSVNEADIGSISRGQTVTFSVDAFPNQVFHGQVGKIRLNATMTQNVVTYTVEVNTRNDDGKLLPYLTANANFNIGVRNGVLVVPNAALRWSPLPNQIVPEAGRKSHAHAGPSGTDREGVHSDGGATQVRGTIWVAQGKLVRPFHVNVGMTDGVVTEVEGRDLTEGLRAAVGETAAESTAGPGAERSPFTPQIRGGKR